MLLDRLDEAGLTDSTVVLFLGDHGPPTGRAKTTCYEAGLRVPYLLRWPGVTSPGVSQALVSAVDITPTFLDAAGIDAAGRMHGQSLRPVAADPDAEFRQTLGAEFIYHGAESYFPRRSVRTDRWKLIENELAGQDNPVKGVDSCPSTRLALTRPAGDRSRQIFERLLAPPRFELYDLQADPWEWVNLADDPQNAETLTKLKGKLADWRRATGDSDR